MKALKRPPKHQVVVTTIKPTFISLKESYKYTGMEEKMFRKTAREYGLSVYARGPKKIWHKVSDLDKMMESFLIIKGKG